MGDMVNSMQICKHGFIMDYMAENWNCPVFDERFLHQILRQSAKGLWDTEKSSFMVMCKPGFITN